MSCTVSCRLTDVELANRLAEAGTLHRGTVELCRLRASRLKKALDVAEHLHSVVADISSQLSQIHNDASSSAAHNTPSSIKHHLSELQACFYLDTVKVKSKVRLYYSAL